jgi:molybdopterin/thiamine biosynthesis adenylyltransferase
MTDAHLIVVGSGGNIGSHLVPLLARTPGVARLTLIDHDVYEVRNLRNQAITPASVKRRKVVVQAGALRAAHPDLIVTPVPQRVEDVPLGRLRGDLILSCLDTRSSRQFVNEAAWRLGVQWLDAGVHADGLLARVDRFVPEPGLPCLECRWTDADFAALEQSYPCRPGDGSIPTGASCGLGALAASMQALACERLLANDDPSALLTGGEQIVIDARHHQLQRTRHLRNPDCRFDHEPPLADIRSITTGVRTLGAFLEWVGGEVVADPRAMEVVGREFVRRLRCARCGAICPTLRLDRSVQSLPSCRICRAAMVAAGFDRVARLEIGELTPADRRCLLSAIGLQEGDVITIAGTNASQHLELRRNRKRGNETVLAHIVRGV